MNEELVCVSEIAKIQVYNILNSWLYNKLDELEKLEDDPKISKEYIESFGKRLEAVKNMQDKLLDLPTCKVFKLVENND